MQSSQSGARLLRRALRVVGAVGGVAVAGGAGFASAVDVAPTPFLGRADRLAPRSDDDAESFSLDSLMGRSGKLRARFIGPSQLSDLPLLTQLFGDSAARMPGVYALTESARRPAFAFISLRPFADKVRGCIGRYRIGYWPFERRRARRIQSTSYANPAGFIEVTWQNQDTYVSEHFRLRDFLTHDQESVWPKYLVLNERLLDKLELVMDELRRGGVYAPHVTVLSGFRTPRYNVRGVGRGGRARTSRHLYGDAADVFVDSDHDGRMDDLNGDGRVNRQDARVLLDAVDRVERAFPELAGGAGIYRATATHGPFVHIDARGHPARWGLSKTTHRWRRAAA